MSGSDHPALAVEKSREEEERAQLVTRLTTALERKVTASLDQGAQGNQMLLLENISIMLAAFRKVRKMLLQGARAWLWGVDSTSDAQHLFGTLMA